jgi:sugar phosphate isomerase/epimerase
LFWSAIRTIRHVKQGYWLAISAAVVAERTWAFETRHFKNLNRSAHAKVIRVSHQNILRKHDFPKGTYRALGAGDLPLREILEAVSNTRAAHVFVEQDFSPDPIASLRQSFAYLKKAGFLN